MFHYVENIYSATSTLVVVLGALVLARYILRAVASPLRDIPGPPLARFTRLWELYNNWQGQLEHVMIGLHRRYGSIVRLAPNRYSISDPTAIRTIYGTGSKFTKSDFYRPFGTLNDAHKDLFSERNNAKHSQERRRSANMYSMSSLVMYEPFVDKVNSEFMAAIAEHARTKRQFDLFTWMQFYAFDVIGEVTIGRSFGLIEAGNDKNGLLHAIHVTGITYGSHAGLIPEIHPLCMWLQGVFPTYSPWKVVMGSIGGVISERTQGESFSDRQDFLEKCTELRKAGKMDQHTMFNTIGANIGAGSDTTGITLTAVIYYLMKNAQCLEKLRSEIETAEQEGRLSSPPTFQEGQKLPYLQATIKEALRLHPAVGQILARVVPEGGAELAGRFFPQGTVVGVNAWVIHNDATIWGPDVQEFRPERWLVDTAQLSSMEHNLLAFGAGSRSCIGKNISLLEMTKLVPSLVKRFDFMPADYSEWKTHSGWFVKQSINARVVDRML